MLYTDPRYARYLCWITKSHRDISSLLIFYFFLYTYAEDSLRFCHQLISEWNTQTRNRITIVLYVTSSYWNCKTHLIQICYLNSNVLNCLLWNSLASNIRSKSEKSTIDCVRKQLIKTSSSRQWRRSALRYLTRNLCPVDGHFCDSLENYYHQTAVHYFQRRRNG